MRPKPNQPLFSTEHNVYLAGWHQGNCGYSRLSTWQTVSQKWELLGWLSGKGSSCQCRRYRFDPWDGKIPWRRKWQPASILAWEILRIAEPGGLQSTGPQSRARLSASCACVFSEWSAPAASRKMTGSIRCWWWKLSCAEKFKTWKTSICHCELDCIPQFRELSNKMGSKQVGFHYIG